MSHMQQSSGDIRATEEPVRSVPRQVQVAGDFNSPPNVPLVISIPNEVLPYRDDIRRFVEAMVYKLSVHASKGRWENKTMEERLEKLEGEVVELREAIARGNMVEILLEGADVANYALIISAIAVERGR